MIQRLNPFCNLRVKRGYASDPVPLLGTVCGKGMDMEYGLALIIGFHVLPLQFFIRLIVSLFEHLAFGYKYIRIKTHRKIGKSNTVDMDLDCTLVLESEEHRLHNKKRIIVDLVHPSGFCKTTDSTLYLLGTGDVALLFSWDDLCLNYSRKFVSFQLACNN